MQGYRVIRFIFALGVCLSSLGVSLSLFSVRSFDEKSYIVQNTYMGPTSPIPGDPYLVRVELLIKDSPDAGGPQIRNVTFDERAIPLKPRDIFGKRGAASFQLPPGKYTLRWTVNRDNIVWPRVLSFEEEVTLSPRDLWVQILIEGERASIL